MTKVLVTIQEPNMQSNTAGSKAKDDVMAIANELGYKNILVENPQGKKNKFKYLLQALLGRLKTTYVQHKPELILFQYAGYNEFMSTIALHQLKKYNKCPFFLFIHDVKTLRSYKEENLESGSFSKREINLFNEYEGLIVHNNKMKKWLSDHGVHVPMISLEIFDYINSEPLNKTKNFDKNINFAGNLYKSTFLTKLHTKTKFIVYGINPYSYGASVDYRGSKSPDEIPKFLNENFGLVWDGDSLVKCSGIDGNYMRYNNPHKTSLYLSSGIPVISWSKAAISKFIEKYNVGIIIDNLEMIDDTLNKLTLDDYRIMKANAERMSLKLRNGEFTKSAFKKIEKLALSEN